MSPIYTTDADRHRQAEVARVLDAAWDCQLHQFASFSPIDWFAIKREQVAGHVELKCRAVPHDRYSTVYLSFRKWAALVLAQLGHGVPSIFAVKFTDEIRWIHVGLGNGEADPRRHPQRHHRPRRHGAGHRGPC